MSEDEKKAPEQTDAPKDAEVTSEPKNEIDELREKADEYLNGWKRARADYENLQRETEERIQKSVKFATEGLLHELLPIVDHFTYAFKAIPAEDRESNWLKGVEHIQTNYMRVLEDHGVEMIPTEGETFNPELHEAVEEVDGDGKQKSGTIAEEVSAGFKLHGKVIQCAKVKVVK